MTDPTKSAPPRRIRLCHDGESHKTLSMDPNVIRLPIRKKTLPRTEQGAWADFQKLAQEAIDNPSLVADLQHATARLRAWRHWNDLFLAKDAG